MWELWTVYRSKWNALNSWMRSPKYIRMVARWSKREIDATDKETKNILCYERKKSSPRKPKVERKGFSQYSSSNLTTSFFLFHNDVTSCKSQDGRESIGEFGSFKLNISIIFLEKLNFYSTLL